MEDFPHLHPAIAMGIRASPGGDQLTAAFVALIPQLGSVVLRVSQHVADFSRQLLQGALRNSYGGFPPCL